MIKKTEVDFHFIDGIKKLKVGDTFIGVASWSIGQSYATFTVTKIGRILITAEIYSREYRFDTLTGEERSDRQGYDTYSSAEGMSKYQEERKFIKEVLASRKLSSITYGQALEIQKILTIKE